MEIYTMQRPSLLLPAVCAPSVPVMPLLRDSVVLTAVRRAPLSQAHQVRTQAELTRTSAFGGSGNGTAGFAASEGFVGNEGVSVKTDSARGVPPRGRPV